MWRIWIDGLHNLRNYCKIVWADRDFDYSYFYELQRFKLLNMVKDFNQNSKFINNGKYVKHMNICISLLDLIIETPFTERYVNFNNTSYKNVTNELKYLYVEDAVREKALRLYTKILNEKSLYWWY